MPRRHRFEVTGVARTVTESWCAAPACACRRQSRGQRAGRAAALIASAPQPGFSRARLLADNDAFTADRAGYRDLADLG
jgi:hypothetical protein